ncbi:MAG: DUF1648 domain-containing protein [Dehalococcoidia bacterium]|nr:DUF1648 domain-containing protein [Dehalococcoidia bacterium]
MQDINLICFIISLSIAALCGTLLSILPILTRKSYLFGVKVPIEKQRHPKAKYLKKRYALVCFAGTMIIFALVIIQYIIYPDASLIAALYFPLLFIPVQMAAFIPNWKQALKLKEEQEWKVSRSSLAEAKPSHSRGDLSETPWGWYILSLILIFACIVIALIKYPGLPDKIPTHFDINMQPDQWSDKSLLSVMTMPLISLSLVLLMFIVSTMFVKAKLQIDPQKTLLSFSQHRIYRRRMGHSIGFMTLGYAIAFALIGFQSIWPDMDVSLWLLMTLLIVPTMPLIFISVLSGQGGCKIKPKVIPEESPACINALSTLDNTFGRDDDEHWALGMFYHNPDDPSYIVEDRFGSNLGFNYSHMPVKIGMLLLISLLVTSYIWITALLCSSTQISV